MLLLVGYLSILSSCVSSILSNDVSTGALSTSACYRISDRCGRETYLQCTQTLLQTSEAVDDTMPVQRNFRRAPSIGGALPNIISEDINDNDEITGII